MTRVLPCIAVVLTFACHPRPSDEAPGAEATPSMPEAASPPATTSATVSSPSATSTGSTPFPPPPYEPINPTTIKELLEVQQGTPEDWLLYDLSGQGDGSQAYGVHVDADGVYWVQRTGRLFRGSLDGTAEPVQIGKFSAPPGECVDSDETYVYFLGGTQLQRWPKGGAACESESVCPALQSTRLLFEHQGGPGPLAVDEQYVYVATHGCAAVTRYDKERFDAVDLFITLPSDGPGNGPTTLVVDGQEMYCAAWGSIFKVPWWDEDDQRIDGSDPAVRLVSSERRIWAMALSDKHVYWAEYAPPGETASFGRFPRGGGPPEVIGPPPGVLRYSVSLRMLYDPGQRAIFFSAGAMSTDSTWRNPGTFITSLSTDDLTWKFYARELPLGYFAIDDRFLYWTSQHLVSSVRRMPLDAEPLFTIEQ